MRLERKSVAHTQSSARLGAFDRLAQRMVHPAGQGWLPAARELRTTRRSLAPTQMETSRIAGVRYGCRRSSIDCGVSAEVGSGFRGAATPDQGSVPDLARTWRRRERLCLRGKGHGARARGCGKAVWPAREMGPQRAREVRARSEGVWARK